MNLGDLEFGAEDFDILCSDHYETDGLQFALAELANQILREKLSNAQEIEVNQNFVGSMYSPKLRMDTVVHQKDVKYTGRLVCIEEVGE